MHALTPFRLLLLVSVPLFGASSPVDDRALNRDFEAYAREIMEAGTGVPALTLRGQLERSHYPTKLGRPHRWKRSLTTAAERARPAVACVGGVYQCETCDQWHVRVAGGFFIHEDGLLVTCHHVVDADDYDTLLIRTAEGRFGRVLEVMAGDEEADIAIVRVEGDHYPSLPLVTGIAEGNRIGIWSHPDGRYYFLGDGIVTRRFMRHTREDHHVETISVSADYAKGSSGSPVFDMAGNVVGMVATTRSVYYNTRNGQPTNLQMVFRDCVSSERILKLLKREVE